MLKCRTRGLLAATRDQQGVRACHLVRGLNQLHALVTAQVNRLAIAAHKDVAREARHGEITDMLLIGRHIQFFMHIKKGRQGRIDALAQYWSWHNSPSLSALLRTTRMPLHLRKTTANRTISRTQTQMTLPQS